MKKSLITPANLLIGCQFFIYSCVDPGHKWQSNLNFLLLRMEVCF